MHRPTTKIAAAHGQWIQWICLFILLAGVSPVEGARVGDYVETHWSDQVARFWSFDDPAVRFAVMGTLLMGVCCGVLGSFLVVRKFALVGDTLAHAVCPGIALGFLWNVSKDPLAIFIGATLAGLLGTVVVHWIKATTHLKEDSALGMVLSGFYAIGICLFSMIQNLEVANKSGLDKFMFGQAAALAENDVKLMAYITLFSLGVIILFYKEFLVASFDSVFARAIGVPYLFFHYTMMVLLTFAVVVSLQATGLVLVSALLITPAATAYLLTDRMHHMLILAAFLGALSGLFGAFLSFLGNGLPTGPFMVVSASVLFALGFLFAPRHGWVPRWWRRRRRTARIQAENTLKAIYQVMERRDFSEDAIRVAELASRRNVSVAAIESELSALVSYNFVTRSAAQPDGQFVDDKTIAFTPSGWQRACEIVRNHRLWELYLTNAALYAVDHVHDDAEKIEHILGEDTVRKLERCLEHPENDPHGKRIPTTQNLHSYAPPGTGPEGRPTSHGGHT